MIVVPRFHSEVLRGLARLAGEERPAEACALVLALKGIVIGVIATPNVSEEPESSFELSLWGTAVWRLLLETGFEVLLFHSHVHGPAVASSGDTRWAAPATRQLIYSVAQDDLRAYAFERGGEGDRQRLRAVEIPVEIV